MISINAEIMLMRLTVRRRNLYIHAYPNYQALFRTYRAYVTFNGRLATVHNRPLTNNCPH